MKKFFEKIMKNSRGANYNPYYRYQVDNQPCVARTSEQAKIFNEYFVIANKKFEKKWANIAAIIAAIVGVVMILVGLVSGVLLDAGLKGKVCAVFGLICLFVAPGLFSYYNKTIKWGPKSVMTDEEYKRRVAEKIAAMRIADRALRQLGLDEEQVREIEPIVLQDKVVDKISLTVYNELERTLYSSTQSVMYIYFTDDQLYVYKIQFDMCCNVVDEWTSEFFYTDICDVSSHVDKNVLTFGGNKIEYSTVSFSIVAQNTSISFTMDGNNAREASINAMRQKIREKKEF